MSVKKKLNKIIPVLNLYKELGETPLQTILRFKENNPIYKNIPITYAGRLDPMAEGALLCLVGEECKNKSDYLDFDKEYEFEILIGFKTDTEDLLGLVEFYKDLSLNESEVKSVFKKQIKDFVGKTIQKYPNYSSKTIDGEQMHNLARQNKLKNLIIPQREIEIYSLKIIDLKSVSKNFLLNKIISRINLVKGDFRQDKIIDLWRRVFGKSKTEKFLLTKFKIKCSSGTYVRAFTRDLGEKIKLPLVTFSILRTKIGKYGLCK